MNRHFMGIFAALLLLFGSIVKPVNASAGKELTVAVAANFAVAMEHISALFTKETGLPVRLTVSSTGRLYTQIKNRAPYDLFYAADSSRPDLLFTEKLCAEPNRYATGEIVLWSSSEEICSLATWQEVVTSSWVKKIAIANPDTAPYGNVARETLEKERLYQAVESKLVYGSNVGQSFQYAAMGVVDAAFVASSSARSEEGKAGCSWQVQEAPKVEQNEESAKRFLEFTLSDRVADIREKFGYGI
jgi:molybdate transport system substrate-binding protein